MEDISPREEVKWFAEQMEKKLRRNDDKGGWDCETWGYLLWRLREETNELAETIESETDSHADYKIENIIEEAVDVANFAMMIADNFHKENNG